MPHQHTILVGVSTNPASIEAVSVACATAKARRSKVVAIHVIEVTRNLPLQSDLEGEARRGEQILRRAEEAASNAGYAIEAELLQAREAGPALVEEAASRDVDALVIGVGPSKVLGDFRLGRTSAFVLRHARPDVWLIRGGTGASHQHIVEAGRP